MKNNSIPIGENKENPAPVVEERKLTNLEIARVFAMYLGCQMTYEDGMDDSIEKEESTLMGITTTGVVNDENADESGEGFYSVEECKLHLTPLPKISDEHAIEVAKIHNRKYWVGPGASQFEIDAITPEMIRDNLVKEGRKLVQHYEAGHRWYEGGSLEWLYSFQQLIMWGYAVPLYFGLNHWANGKTAIELNIAKEKQP